MEFSRHEMAVTEELGAHGAAERASTQLLVRNEWTGGAYCLVRQSLPIGKLMPGHVHQDEDQLAYVVSGSVGFRVGDEEFVGGPGTSVFRPRGIPHALWNASKEPATILEVTSPGPFEDYFRVMSDSMAAGASRDRLEEIAAEWGVGFFEDWNDELCARYDLTMM